MTKSVSLIPFFLGLLTSTATWSAGPSLPSAPHPAAPPDMWGNGQFKLAQSLEALLQQEGEAISSAPNGKQPLSLEALMQQQADQDAIMRAKQESQRKQVEQRRRESDQAKAALTQCQSQCDEAYRQCESRASALTTQSLATTFIGALSKNQGLMQQAMSNAQDADNALMSCSPEQTLCNSTCEQQAYRVASPAGGGGVSADCNGTVANLTTEIQRITPTLGGSMCEAQRPLYDFYRNRAIPQIRRACPANHADAAQTLAYLQGEVDRMAPLFNAGGTCNLR